MQHAESVVVECLQRRYPACVATRIRYPACVATRIRHPACLCCNNRRRPLVSLIPSPRRRAILHRPDQDLITKHTGHTCAYISVFDNSTRLCTCSTAPATRFCAAVVLEVNELAKPAEMPCLCCNTQCPHLGCLRWSTQASGSLATHWAKRHADEQQMGPPVDRGQLNVTEARHLAGVSTSNGTELGGCNNIVTLDIRRPQDS